jgi:hypothetical protein
MSKQDKAQDDLPNSAITRRATLRLATAVAAFGAAMGLSGATVRGEDKPKETKAGAKKGAQESATKFHQKTAAPEGATKFPQSR